MIVLKKQIALGLPSISRLSLARPGSAKYKEGRTPVKGEATKAPENPAKICSPLGSGSASDVDDEF